MRTLIQRVQHASVTIDGQLKSKIGKGLLVLVGIEDRDTQEDIEWLCKKIANMQTEKYKARQAAHRAFITATVPEKG